MSLTFVTSSRVGYNMPSIPARWDILTSHFVIYLIVLCNKVSLRSPTNKAGEDVMESVWKCVKAWGNFQKKVSICSLMLASKLVIGFENSIQACN